MRRNEKKCLGGKFPFSSSEDSVSSPKLLVLGIVTIDVSIARSISGRTRFYVKSVKDELKQGTCSPA